MGVRIVLTLLISIATSQAQQSSSLQCSDFSGQDASSRLNACIAALPSTGGTADVSGLAGEQFSSPIQVDRPVQLLFGCGTIRIVAPINVKASNVAIRGACQSGYAVLKRASGYEGRFISYAQQGYSGLQVSGMEFDNSSGGHANDDSSTVIFLLSGNNETYIHNNVFSNMGAGRAIGSAGGSVAPRQVRIEYNKFSGSPPIVPIATDGLVRTGGQVIVTTASSHSFVRGEEVYISGTSDASFAGIHVVAGAPSSTKFTFNQAGPDATSSGGTAQVTNFRSISLVTPGVDVRVLNNHFDGTGGITMEPSSAEAGGADGPLQVCNNTFNNVDATNMLIRAHDQVRVQNVTVCNNHSENAGLQVGKGCIAVGENVSKTADALFANVSVTGNTCHGWGSPEDSSIGIDVAGAAAGSNTRDLVIANNVLDGRTPSGRQPENGYGMFIRNFANNFTIEHNTIENTGRSCIAVTSASAGTITNNTCDNAVLVSRFSRPSPAGEGCYHMDANAANITLENDVCRNPGTSAGPSNGFFVSDHAQNITLINNTATSNNGGMLRGFMIGTRATNIRVSGAKSSGGRDPDQLPLGSTAGVKPLQRAPLEVQRMPWPLIRKP
jgi:parallel beta-helix repeat protein